MTFLIISGTSVAKTKKQKQKSRFDNGVEIICRFPSNYGCFGSDAPDLSRDFCHFSPVIFSRVQILEAVSFYLPCSFSGG